MKLSKTMQAVMDNLANAEHYYSVPGRTGGIVLHNNKGAYRIGNQKAWIYADGSCGVTENTRTLEGLEKRGLIKILSAGGDTADAIEVVGMTPHAPIEKAVVLKVTREARGKDWGPDTLIEYMDPSATTAKEVEAYYNENFPFHSWIVEEDGEIELSRWDWRK